MATVLFSISVSHLVYRWIFDSISCVLQYEAITIPKYAFGKG